MSHDAMSNQESEVKKVGSSDFFPDKIAGISFKDQLFIDLNKVYDHLPAGIKTEKDKKNILDQISQRVRPVSQHSATGELPAQSPQKYLKKDDTYAECTLANALAKLALERSGHKNFCSAIVQGHQLLVEQRDSGLIFSDVSTTVTKDGKLEASSFTVDSKDVKKDEKIFDSKGNFLGSYIYVELDNPPANQDVFSSDKLTPDGKYYQEIFISEPSTYIEPTVIQRNLDSLNGITRKLSMREKVRDIVEFAKIDR